MNRRQFVMSVFCVTGIGSGISAQATSPRYYVQQIQRGNRTVLRLQDRRKHNIVWQRTFWRVEWPTFSQDHHAFAAQVRDEGTPPFALLLWQAGRPVRILTKQSFFNGDVDGIVDLAWSPDRKRLALLTWAGGGSLDAQSYEIWYMNVPKETFGFSGISRVRRMRWTGARQVRYWQTRHRKAGMNPPDVPPFPAESVSHVWTCP